MASKVYSTNFLNIQGWMLRLGLSSFTEVAAFALVYGFSQDNNSEFSGSLSYIQDWLMCSRPTAIKVMKTLEDKNFIIKTQLEISNVIVNKYKVNLRVVNETYYQLNSNFIPSKDDVFGASKDDLPPSKEALHNNKDINNIEFYKENNIDNISPSIPQGDECEEMSQEKILFEEFRKIYLGTKRGLDIEFANFCKKHKDWREVLPYLKVNYERQIDAKKSQRGSIDPRYEKHLQTYINQRCWEEEINYGSNSINTQSAHGTQRESLQEWADRQPKLVY
jgi:hypothetical protein